MKKYEDFIDKHLKEAIKEGVKIIHLGRKDRLPKSLVKKIINAEKKTKNNTKYILNIALDYGGRDEILRATRKMLAEGLPPEKLDEEVYSQYLDTHDQPYPYPDLLIRPSGEQRTSGMFSWQGAYTEIYWLPDHFPDSDAEKLREIIIDFSKRRRRFGGNDDVPKVKFNPIKTAKLEIGWWKAHQDGDLGRLLRFLTDYLSELYGIEKRKTKPIARDLLESVKYHNQKDWLKARKAAVKAFEMIKKITGYVFTPETAAHLEINWWKVHGELEEDLDKTKLEKALRDYFGEIYRLSELQATKAAHFKTLATVAYDLVEKSMLEKERKKYWDLAEKYLIESYKALRYVAS